MREPRDYNILYSESLALIQQSRKVLALLEELLQRSKKLRAESKRLCESSQGRSAT